MTNPANILYQAGECWIVQTGRTYEVCIPFGTAGRVMDRIGISYPDAFNYAMKCCDRREETRALMITLNAGRS